MPQSATIQAPAVASIPAPRATSDQNPHLWVLELPSCELALALALSDLPRTPADQQAALGDYLPASSARSGAVERRKLNPVGVRRLLTWAAQGVDRAGGELALWLAANQWRSLNINRTWQSAEGKAFTRRFGSQRRNQHATDWARYLPNQHTSVKVQVPLTRHTIDAVRYLDGLYDSLRENPDVPGMCTEVLFTMSRRDARMAARTFDLTLVAHLRGGYLLT